MRITVSRIARLPWPRRRVRTERPAPVAELGGPLRAFRAAALWGISVLILTAAGSAFAESYRGLWLWAGHHGLAGVWSAAFPLQVDLFVAVGELVLFIAVTDRWGWRDRAGAWSVALLGLAASVAGNVGHVAAHDLQSRGTAAVPPLAAFAALWLGLGVLKRIVRRGPGHADTADETAQDSTAGARLAGTLEDLAEAVRALAARADDTVPSAGPRADEAALLGELLEAVREVGARIGGMVSTPVPSGAEHAALIAYRATVVAGNPHSMNALQARFGLTRTQVTRIRAVIAEEEGGQVPAEVNGHQFGAADAETSSIQ
jgi:Protein of unknown function (DUF2637)